ncbi:hypothetical protein [Hyphomonas sp.]|uniref:hypothetical protein n=1 Tax=Hyphomonas sp. TaxID=87 RepID=UPI0025BCCA94|nr:hypothetical protein [Hyphomonas sp.]
MSRVQSVDKDCKPGYGGDDEALDADDVCRNAQSCGLRRRWLGFFDRRAATRVSVTAASTPAPAASTPAPASSASTPASAGDGLQCG